MTKADIERMKADINRAIDITPISFSIDQANQYLKSAITGIIDEYEKPKPIEWTEEEKERMLKTWEEAVQHIGKIANKQ